MLLDESIKMPVASDWAERKKWHFQVPTGYEKGEGRKRRIEILEGEMEQTQSAGKIYQDVGRKGKWPTEGQLESILGSETNGLHRR